jgi:hypothetical protein
VFADPKNDPQANSRRSQDPSLSHKIAKPGENSKSRHPFFRSLIGQSGGVTAHTINLNPSPSADPRIGSRIQISQTGDREHIQFILVTTLYNDGDAAASRVDGRWELKVSRGLLCAERTVRLDSLPSFLPHVISHSIGGTINNPFFDPSVRITLEIDLMYLGLKSAEQRSYVRYDYNTQQRAFIPVSYNKGA